MANYSSHKKADRRIKKGNVTVERTRLVVRVNPTIIIVSSIAIL